MCSYNLYFSYRKFKYLKSKYTPKLHTKIYIKNYQILPILNFFFSGVVPVANLMAENLNPGYAPG